MRVFADKAAGYGVPGHHDRRHRSRGRSPRAFAWAAERARAGLGPTLIETGVRCACAATRTTTTCCTSARIRSRRGTTRRSTEQGYAEPRAVRVLGRARSDRALRGAARGRRASSRPAISIASSARPRRSSRSEARAVIDAPWPEPAQAGRRRVRERAAARARRGAGSRRSG